MLGDGHCAHFDRQFRSLAFPLARCYIEMQGLIVVAFRITTGGKKGEGARKVPTLSVYIIVALFS